MIEKITDQNLERYDSRLKEWCDRKFFEKDNYGKYETTEEAGAVAFYPAPNTLLEGKVKFSFKETMPANGDKGPENPSTITGVSNIYVVHCGKNIAPSRETVSYEGVTFTNNGDGSWTVNGTASNANSFIYLRSFSSKPVFCLAGQQITASGCPSGGSSSTYSTYMAVQRKDGSYITTKYETGNSATITLPEDGYVSYQIIIKKGTTVNNLVFRPQLELGFTATAFEPYEGNDYTIQFGNTYYGGEIDLATGVMTVTHTAIKIGDISGFTYRSDFGGCWTPASTLQPGASYTETPVCTHAIFESGADFSSATDGVFRWGAGGTNKTWWYFKSTATTPEEFYAEYGDAYLAFKLQNPYTVQLTLTQILALAQPDKYTPRLNTIYTDADSVQISYLKSPIRDEYEKTQAILSLGGNS